MAIYQFWYFTHTLRISPLPNNLTLPIYENNKLDYIANQISRIVGNQTGTIDSSDRIQLS